MQENTDKREENRKWDKEAADDKTAISDNFAKIIKYSTSVRFFHEDGTGRQRSLYKRKK